MTAHAVLSASSAHRWTACPGSVAAIEAATERDNERNNEAAKEGTGLHELLRICLDNVVAPEDVGEFEYDYQGETLTMLANEEQCEAVQKVIDLVNTIPGIISTETRVNYGYILGVDPALAFGTSDVIVIDGPRVHVIDAKFGRHFVSQVENPQMLLYGIATVDALEALGDEVTDLFLHIGQPRAGHQDPEGWHIKRGDLNEWINWFRGKVRDVERARPMRDTDEWRDEFLRPDNEACRYCPLRASCPALKREFDAMMEHAVEAADLEDFAVIDDLAVYMAKVERMEIFIAAVREEAMRRLMGGKPVEGFKLVKGRAGNRQWTDEANAEKAILAAGVPKDALFSPPKMKSPAQAEKVLKKHVDKNEIGAILAPLTKRNPPKPTIVPESQGGEPWVPGASLDEFGVV